jgi:hypothetical protein
MANPVIISQLVAGLMRGRPPGKQRLAPGPICASQGGSMAYRRRLLSNRKEYSVDSGKPAPFHNRMHRDQPKYLKVLQKLISKLHHCRSEHMKTVFIGNETVGGTIWGGEVEVFALEGCEKAKICYAFSRTCRIQGRNIETVHTVLRLPPIDDLRSAVLSVLDAEALSRRAQREIHEALAKL